MRVLIADQNRTVTIRLYGLNGNEVTREYFSLFFLEVIEIHETTDTERNITGTDAEFTVATTEVYEALYNSIVAMQEAIDDVSDKVDEGRSHTEFIIDNRFYAI